MNQEAPRRRLFVIDILRVICAILIYLRHSNTMYGCTYGGKLDEIFIRMTSPVMTCFFLLSGFSIHYQHRLENETGKWARSFIKKRLISIMPSYLLLVIIWPIVHPTQLRDWILLLPVDLFGIQTTYNTLFGILHNGGTWFVSCMLLCYICYPIMKSVMESSNERTPWTIMIIAHFLLMYSNIIIPEFSLDRLYSNPIARAGEYLIGVSFAEIVLKKGNNNKKKRALEGLLSVIFLCGISIIIAFFSKEDNKTRIYTYQVIPIVLFIILISMLVSFQRLEKSKILSALSGMSYQFFLAQLFLWDLTSWVLKVINMSGNIAKIITSFILCTLLSFVIWKYYDKPIKRILQKKLRINS